MSRELYYICDRCKNRIGGTEMVRSLDLGNNYDGEVNKPKERLLVDLCGPCWKETKTFLRIPELSPVYDRFAPLKHKDEPGLS